MTPRGASHRLRDWLLASGHDVNQRPSISQTRQLTHQDAVQAASGRERPARDVDTHDSRVLMLLIGPRTASCGDTFFFYTLEDHAAADTAAQNTSEQAV